MRNIFSICILGLILSISSPCVFAEQGYYIEEEVTTPPIFGLPKNAHLTRTWITNTQLRRDEGDKRQTLLIDTQHNEAWLVRHQDSTLIKMDMTTFQGLALMTMMMFGVTYDTLTGEPVIPDSIFYQTGRKSRIGDWNCKEVIVHRQHPDPARKGNQPVVMWVTITYGTNRSLYASILKAMMGPLASQYTSFFDQLERLGGYPAELYTRAMGMEITQKLQILESRDIPESIFHIPSGYRIDSNP
jgi:hypothetical protein